MVLLLALAALAQDAPPSDAPPAAPSDAPPAPDAVAPGTPSEDVVIFESSEVLRRRAAVYSALKEEGYRKGRDLGDRTVFKPYSPWKPQVIVYDDGWVRLRRSPPRVHPPGRTFADQGKPTEYLWCILAPTQCVSIGGWIVTKKKLDHVKSDVYDATRDEVAALNDAVARRELAHRLNEDIPRDLELIWARTDLGAADRHTLLYTYWDTRTEGPEGLAARGAIRAFLIGVVQASSEPFTRAELAVLNAGRASEHPLDLPLPEDPS